MGLETVHPDVLPRLNKHLDLEDFRDAATRLKRAGIRVRTFILLRPPFLSEADGVLWACRSLDFAQDCGVDVCVVIPTRGGNGVMEDLAARREFEPPNLASLEACLDYGLQRGRGRVFVDLWDAEQEAVGD